MPFCRIVVVQSLLATHTTIGKNYRFRLIDLFNIRARNMGRNLERDFWHNSFDVDQMVDQRSGTPCNTSALCDWQTENFNYRPLLDCVLLSKLDSQ